MSLSSQLTIVIVTSPVKCHPSTEMIDRLFGSLHKHCSALVDSGCQFIIMCDGYTIGPPKKKKIGRIDPDRAER